VEIRQRRRHDRGRRDEDHGIDRSKPASHEIKNPPRSDRPRPIGVDGPMDCRALNAATNNGPVLPGPARRKRKLGAAAARDDRMGACSGQQPDLQNGFGPREQNNERKKPHVSVNHTLDPIRPMCAIQRPQHAPGLLPASRGSRSQCWVDGPRTAALCRTGRMIRAGKGDRPHEYYHDRA